MAWTLTQIRQWAAREAGKFHVSTCTSGTTVSTVEDTSWPVNSSIAASGLYKDYWLYTPASATADQVRLVKTYTPTGGLLAVDTNYGTKPSTGAAYELHGMFPPGGANTTWTTLINDGLKNCLVPIEYSFNPSSSNITRFSLATVASWLTDPWLVRNAGVLASGTSRESTDPYVAGRIHGHCTLDGPTVYFDAWPRTFATTDTIYLTVLTPAYYAIQANGSGAFTQTGMSLETDVAPIDNLELAGYAALVEAWRRDSQRLDTATAAGRNVNSLAAAVAAFNEMSPEWNKRIPLQLRRIRQWGPPRYGGVGPYVSGWNHG